MAYFTSRRALDRGLLFDYSRHLRSPVAYKFHWSPSLTVETRPGLVSRVVVGKFILREVRVRRQVFFLAASTQIIM